MAVLVAVTSFAIWLADKYGRATLGFKAIVMIVMALLCLSGVYVIPWLWNAGTVPERVFRVSSATALVLIAVGSFWFWVSRPTGEALGKPPVTSEAVVDTLFEKAYSAYGSQIGRPEAKSEVIDHVSYDRYEKATVIWMLHEPVGHLILHVESSTWSFQDDNVIPRAADPVEKKYYDLNLRRKEFRDCPRDKEPPVGGIMRLWQGDPKHWKNLLGWREWGGTSRWTVRSQRFEGGRMIGPLPLYKYGGPPNSPGQPNAFILVLLNRKAEWKSVRTTEIPARWDAY